MSLTQAPVDDIPTISPQGFEDKYLGRFADNQFENINEGTFREFVTDIRRNFLHRLATTTNDIRGGPYRIPNTSSLGTIPAYMLVLEMEAIAVSGGTAQEVAAADLAGRDLPSVYFKLVRNRAGSVLAYIDEKPETTQKVTCVWVRTSGTEDDRVNSYPQLVLDDHQPYDAGDVVKHTFENGQTRLLEIKVDLPLASSQTNPTPTGQDNDPYYVNFASLTSDDDLPFQLLTTWQLTNLIREKKLKPARFYRLMRYEPQEGSGEPGGLGQAPPRAEFDVVVCALSTTDYAPEVWAIDNGSGAVLTTGTYDLATDTFTAGSGATYWITLPASANDGTTVPAYVSQRLLSYVLSNDPRLTDARRIIQARRNSGEWYTGTDGNLLAAVHFAGEHSLILLQQVYNLEASFTLPRGVCLDGNNRYFRLDSHRISLSRQSAILNAKIEYIWATGGDLYSAFGAHNAETPRLGGCEIRVDVTVAAGCFMRLTNCDLVLSNWNKGGGTVILENCREFGIRGSGAGFADVQVIDTGAVAVPVGTAVTLTQNTSYHFSSGTFTVDPNGRVVGAVARLVVAAGVALPAALSAAPFLIPPSSAMGEMASERLVTLEVLRDLRILTTITPLS